MSIATVTTLRCDVPGCPSRFGLTTAHDPEALTTRLLAAAAKGWVVARVRVGPAGQDPGDWCPRHRQPSRRPHPGV